MFKPTAHAHVGMFTRVSRIYNITNALLFCLESNCPKQDINCTVLSKASSVSRLPGNRQLVWAGTDVNDHWLDVCNRKEDFQ